MLILSVDSSASPASVCLYDGEKIIADYYINCGFTHSQTLMTMIESVLSVCGYTAQDVDLFAVNQGPGSFTGVRIGVSAVKGMAYAADKPCVETSTLESMAHLNLSYNGIVCACMDARRQQVYNALFRIKDGSVERICEDRAIALEDLKRELEAISGSIILVGDGAELAYRYLEENKNVALAPPDLRYQRASAAALVAFEKAKTGDVVSAAALMPSYLRLSQAEREMKKKQKES